MVLLKEFVLNFGGSQVHVHLMYIRNYQTPENYAERQSCRFSVFCCLFDLPEVDEFYQS